MDPRKARGIDGLFGPFFRENWDTVGRDVLRFCHDFFNGKQYIGVVNDTVIVLIPKNQEPNKISNFRLISLCRVLFKIISKVLVNRLKTVFHYCIS